MISAAILDLYSGDWPSNNDAVGALKRAATDGVKLVIIKASEGDNKDSHVYDWVSAAKSAGVQAALYHFGHSGDPETQADMFSQIAAACQLDPIKADLPFPRYWLDWEREDKKATGGAQLTPMSADEASRFVTRASQRLGETLGVYTGDLARELLGDTKHPVLSKSPLWLAYYGSNPIPYIPRPTWNAYTAWQFTDGSNGPLPHTKAGFPGKTDLDISHYAGGRLEGWGTLAKGILTGGLVVAGFVLGGPVGAAAGAAAGLGGIKVLKV